MPCPRRGRTREILHLIYYRTEPHILRGLRLDSLLAYLPGYVRIHTLSYVFFFLQKIFLLSKTTFTALWKGETRSFIIHKYTLTVSFYCVETFVQFSLYTFVALLHYCLYQPVVWELKLASKCMTFLQTFLLYKHHRPRNLKSTNFRYLIG